MKALFLSATALMFCLSPALAETQAKERELSAPLLRMTPVLKQNADMLQLNDAQRADLKSWLGVMPAKRQALEQQARDARAALRQAVLEGAPLARQQALADELGALEAHLLMARAKCVAHWRDVLSEEQFAQAVALTVAH